MFTELHSRGILIAIFVVVLGRCSYLSSCTVHARSEFGKAILGARAVISQHDTEDRQAPALCVAAKRMYSFTTEQKRVERTGIFILKGAFECETYHNADTHSNTNLSRREARTFYSTRTQAAFRETEEEKIALRACFIPALRARILFLLHYSKSNLARTRTRSNTNSYDTKTNAAG